MDRQTQHMNRLIRQAAGRLPEIPTGAVGAAAVADHGSVDGGAHGAKLPPSLSQIMNQLLRDAAGMPGRSFTR